MPAALLKQKTDTNATANDDAAEDKEIRIKLTFSGGEATAVLYDNPTTQSLLSQLPARVVFTDFASSEKVSYPSDALSAECVPDGADLNIGDAACYNPWGNIVFYYNDQPYAGRIIRIGRVTSGLEKLMKINSDFEVVIDQTK